MTETPSTNGTSTESRAATSSTSGGTPITPPPAKPARPRPGAGWLLLVLVLGFGGGIGGYYAADQLSDDAGSTVRSDAPIARPSSATPPPKRKLDKGEQYSPAEIYEQAAPAVVHINATVRVQSESIFGFPQEQEGVASGSGFVIDDEGHIVTNAHVVQDAESIEVGFDNDKTLEAEVVGQDLSNDIAVLKVKASKKQLHPISFADSTQMQVGDPVVAIGNPFSLDRTLTTGVVSALQRQIRGLNNFAINDVIQTDAAVNRGNSGGPLLNMRGEVIGVNSQIQTGSSGDQGNVGIAFAVPSNTVDNVVQQLLEDGKVSHAWLGIEGRDVDAAAAEVFNLPVKEGVLVATVSEDSPADKAGLSEGTKDVMVDGNRYVLGGDIIVEFDGKKVATMQEIADAVNRHKVGDEVEVVYYRDEDKKTAKLKLGSRPDDLELPADR